MVGVCPHLLERNVWLRPLPCRLSRHLPTGAIYRRWRENMVTLHKLMGRGGDDWSDLLCIGSASKKSGIGSETCLISALACGLPASTT